MKTPILMYTPQGFIEKDIVEKYVLHKGNYMEVVEVANNTPRWEFWIKGNTVMSIVHKKNGKSRNFSFNNVPKALRALFLVKGYTFESQQNN